MMRRVLLLPVVGTVLLLIGAGGGSARPGEPMAAVAVFPVDNWSAGRIPADAIRQAVVGRLTAEGIRVLDDEALAAFVTRHRVRYTSGIDAATAGLLRQETGVDGVVFASVELSSSVAPPKVALFVRLVSIGASPVVVWADDVGMAGDDSPGLYELGVVNDYDTLLTRALDRLGNSLVAFLKTGQDRTTPARAAKFQPKFYHKALALAPGTTYSVAVLPFVNASGRRNAGEVLASLFIRHLSAAPGFRVADTGVARRQLLDARIIMDGGISLSDAETVAALLDADFVLGGRVLRYEDYDGPSGRAGVEFSAVLIERTSRKVVWSSDSYNEGRDGVVFFEWGATRTAHAMATQMVRRTTEMMAGSGR